MLQPSALSFAAALRLSAGVEVVSTFRSVRDAIEVPLPLLLARHAVVAKSVAGKGLHRGGAQRLLGVTPEQAQAES